MTPAEKAESDQWWRTYGSRDVLHLGRSGRLGEWVKASLPKLAPVTIALPLLFSPRIRKLAFTPSPRG